MDRETILVIDDEKALLELISLSLKKTGYEVHTASCGKDGVEKAKKLLPSLIILDLIIPDMNGWEIVNILENRQDTAGKPIIILSAIPPDDDIESMLDEKLIYYMTKPFSFEMLINVVNSVINEYRNSNDSNFKIRISSCRKEYLKKIGL